MLKPWKISDAEVAFGQVNNKLPTLQECYEMKDKNEIPSKYEKLVSDWFFSGLTELNPTPREGINADDALQCIRAEMVSWSRKHEHKTMLVAWLCEQRFSDVQWKKAEKQLSQ